MRPRIGIVLATATHILVFGPKASVHAVEINDYLEQLDEASKLGNPGNAENPRASVTKGIGIIRKIQDIEARAQSVSDNQHVTLPAAYAQLTTAKVGGYFVQSAVTTASGVAITSGGPIGIGVGAVGLAAAPRMGDNAEAGINAMFERANLGAWFNSNDYQDVLKAQRTLSRPPASIGTDASVPSSRSDDTYARAPAGMDTPPGSSCIDYNTVGPSTCKDGSDQSGQGLSDGGDVTGRWAMEGGSCAAPVIVTKTEMRGFISPMQNAYCNISGLVPVQPPKLWRFQVSCMGNQGGAIDVRLSRMDANRLTYSSCFQAAQCSTGTMTRCN